MIYKKNHIIEYYTVIPTEIMASDTISSIESKLKTAAVDLSTSSTCCLAAKKLTTNDEAYKSLAEGLDVYIIQHEGSKRTEKYRRCGRSAYGDGNKPLCWKHWEVQNNPTFKMFDDVIKNSNATKASIKDFEAKAKKKENIKATKYNAKKLVPQPNKEVLSFVITKTPEITKVFEDIQNWLNKPIIENPKPDDLTPVHEKSLNDESLNDEPLNEETVPVDDQEEEEKFGLSDISVEDPTETLDSNDLDLDDSETEEVSMECLTTCDGIDYGYEKDTNNVWLVGDSGEGEMVGSLVETKDQNASIYYEGKRYFILDTKKVNYKGSALDMCFHSHRCYKNGKYIGKMENGILTK